MWWTLQNLPPASASSGLFGGHFRRHRYESKFVIFQRITYFIAMRLALIGPVQREDRGTGMSRTVTHFD
jgi:hypothetical protein